MLAAGSTGEQTTGPVSISVVREDGRWFVSPVTTVLGIVDNTVHQIDQRMIYSLFGLAYELPPDGTITLDHSFQVASSRGWLNSSVYAFDGRAGQKIVGEISGGASGDSERYPYAYGRVYTTDGEEIGSVDFQVIPTGADSQYFYANSVELPKTGSYRLVIDPYPTTDRALTVWDLDHAPKALRKAAEGSSDSGGSCTSSAEGLFGSSEKCAVEISPLTPTTVIAGSSSSSSSSSSNGYGSKSMTATSIAYPPATIAPVTIAPATRDSSP